MSESPVKVAFMIDEQSLMRSKIAFENIMTCIRRILLFYRFITKDVLWSFRFFSTATRYSCMSMRHFYPMSSEYLDLIMDEYQKRDTQRPSTITPGTPMSRITQLLKETVSDFQWESHGLSASTNYAYIITASPSNVSEACHYFHGDHYDDDLSSFSIDSEFAFLKEQLKEEGLVETYKKTQLSISMIDTSLQPPASDTAILGFQRSIRKKFCRMYKLFKGNFFNYQDICKSNGRYGSSFMMDLCNYLPCKFVPPSVGVDPVPLWHGDLINTNNLSMGKFSIFLQKNLDLPAHVFEFAKDLRITKFVHTSQVSLHWFAGEYDLSFKLVHGLGDEENDAFGMLLDMLYDYDMVALIEIDSKDRNESITRTACLSPLESHCGYLRVLEADVCFDELPSPTEAPVSGPADWDVVIPGLSKVVLPDTPSSNESCFEDIDDLPDSLKELLKKNGVKIETEVSQEPEYVDVSDDEEQVIALPKDIALFAKQFKKLYFETIYAQKYILEDVITILATTIDYLLKHGVPSDEIAHTLLDYALTTTELDMKHKEKVAKAQFLPPGTGSIEEQYLSEWWQLFKGYNNYDPLFQELSLTFLRLKEAQLQVILYCFVNKLEANPIEKLNTDANELAQAFFVKMVLIFLHNKVEDHVTSIDADEGAFAVSRRDPCDLNDKSFAFLLEDKFKESLPELVQVFKEASGEDDLMSIPDDGEEDLFAAEIAALNEAKKADLNKNDAKQKKTSQVPSNLDLKSLLPKKPVRTDSNPIPSFMKRTISMNTKSNTSAEGRMGEAAKAAVARINRSMMNGKPTMKRAGGFIKSANSPKRQKTAPRADGAVVLRRTATVDPEVTPRTSLNRFLNTNIFADYSEYCMSPSKDDLGSAAMIPSTYQKTPKTSLSRHQKPNHTPHRYEVEVEDLGLGLDDESSSGGFLGSLSFADRIWGLRGLEDKVESSSSLTLQQRKSKINDLFNDDMEEEE